MVLYSSAAIEFSETPQFGTPFHSNFISASVLIHVTQRAKISEDLSLKVLITSFKSFNQLIMQSLTGLLLGQSGYMFL